MSNEITTTAPLTLSETNFALAQRQAQAMAASNLVPEAYRNNVPNCLIAMEVAHRTGSSPMLVAQNMHVIHGRPSWSSQFIIAALNSCGRFSPLRFRMTAGGCVAWAKDMEDGEILEGPEVTLEMAKAEGWSTKNGSKWRTMPELMLRYRAAAFFGRLYAPEVLMGMHTSDEVEDFAPRQRQASGMATSSVAQAINAAIAAPTDDVIDVESEEVVESEPEPTPTPAPEPLAPAQPEPTTNEIPSF